MIASWLFSRSCLLGLLRLALVLLAAVRLASSCPAADDEAVVATVGGEPIHAAEVNRLLGKATGGKPANEAAAPFLKAEILEEIVARRLVLAYARRTGEAASAEDIEAALTQLKKKLATQRQTLDAFLTSRAVSQNDLRRQLAWNLVWEKYLGRYVTPVRRDVYFTEHRRDLDGTRITVSQILLPPGPAAGADALLKQAEDIRRQIMAGTISFVAAAEKYSAGATAKEGGSVGSITRHGAMSEGFARAAFALDVGQVSRPIRTPLGVHLIRCDAIDPGKRQLADVRKEVDEALARELMEKLAALQRPHTAVEYRSEFPHFKPGTHELQGPQKD